MALLSSDSDITSLHGSGRKAPLSGPWRKLSELASSGRRDLIQKTGVVYYIYSIVPPLKASSGGFSSARLSAHLSRAFSLSAQPGQ